MYSIEIVFGHKIDYHIIPNNLYNGMINEEKWLKVNKIMPYLVNAISTHL